MFALISACSIPLWLANPKSHTNFEGWPKSPRQRKSVSVENYDVGWSHVPVDRVASEWTIGVGAHDALIAKYPQHKRVMSKSSRKGADEEQSALDRSTVVAQRRGDPCSGFQIRKWSGKREPRAGAIRLIALHIKADQESPETLRVGRDRVS